MSWLLPILKSKFAVLGAVLIVVLLIVIGGPRVFGSGARLWCYLAGALILIGYLLYLLIKKWRAKKNARMLEGFLNQQADDQMLSARPDVQDELAAIKEKLNRAIQILKRSRIARGRRGAEALYVLPWYMIIGPSGCGKSTAIRNSGLHFPPVDPDAEDPGKIKGLGGTRNCDWWFSNEGIILDTAGRYTLSPNIQEDREEWSSFLHMLRKVRRRSPINGLILAISVNELLQMDAEGLEAHARALRSRIDELIIKLEILFPIYVVFTKCDLISGFVEFFGDLSKGDREQVWGYTRKYEPARRPLHEEFVSEFDALSGVLERRRVRQLAAELRPVQKRGTYLFPVEFAAARRQLSAFVETLFRPNPYQQNPIVRGFYFTSGTQEGTPIAQVMAAMRKEFGLSADQVAQVEPVKETKAYFIKDLFQEVILPDEAKVHPTTQAWRRRRLLRAAAIVAQILVTTLLSVILFISYGNNRRNNDSLAQTADRVARATRTRGTPSFHFDFLDTLDILRERLVAVESGVPLMSRWGLHSGDIVATAAREAYFQRYHDLLLAPTAQQLSQTLTQNLNAPFDCEDTTVFNGQYSAFTAYQMLTLPYDSIPMAPSKLRKQIESTWQWAVDEDRMVEFRWLVEEQVDYYWRHRNETAIPGLQVRPDRNVLAAVKAQLDQCWSPARLYQTMIDEINEELGEYAYLDAVTTMRLEGGTVGRAFTREGWEREVRERIERMPEEIAADPVRKEAFSAYTDEDIRKQLTDFYIGDFVSKWRGFVASGTVLRFHNLTDAFDGIEELSQDPSPMVRVLEKVFEQSEITDAKGKRFSRIEDEFHALGRFLGRRSSDPGVESGKDKYLALLSTLPADVQGIEQTLSGEARCAENLKRFNGDLELKAGKVKRLLRGAGLAGVSADFLSQPLEMARLAAAGGACGCLDREWAKVLEAYNVDLADSYPFSPSSSVGASPQQVETFFTRTFKSFVDGEIKPAEQLGIPISQTFQRARRAAESIQRVLARGGTGKLRFTLTAAAGNMSDIRSLEFQYSTEPVWTYVMGQAQTREYKWPQPGGGDCRMHVDPVMVGVYYTPLKFQGDWGIFKMFDAASEESPGRLAWEFKSSSGRPLKARLTLGGNDAAFILAGHFTQFKCPQVVCR